MPMTFRIIGGLLVFGWAMSFAWVFGMWVAHLVHERRNLRRRRALVAERAANERRIADDFYRWEREYIEWRRRVSEGRHPSHSDPEAGTA